MRIRLTRNTMVNGSPALAGETMETNDHDALYLIRIGKATAVKEEPERAVIEPGETAETNKFVTTKKKGPGAK